MSGGMGSMMRVVQLEDELSDMRLRAAQLRKFLAGALCACCGEPLGEGEELTQEAVEDDESRTIHKRCEEKSDECVECGRNIETQDRCEQCERDNEADRKRQDTSD